jgi:hypothetical protein
MGKISTIFGRFYPKNIIDKLFMESETIVKISSIIFFIGIILIFISWYHTFPVKISSVDEYTFYQFSILLWPGTVLSLIGLFFLALYSKLKIIKAICCSVIPLILNSVVFFYTFISASDAGAARGMFQVFQKAPLDSSIIPYFEFPTFFSLNELISQIAGLDQKAIAILSFTLYGVLLGLYLFLFYDNLKNRLYKNLTPVLSIVMYFIGLYSFLNYQWVPQTLALVYFFMLVMLSSYILFHERKIKWSFMMIVIFAALVMSHAFIPVIFLSFLGILFVKERYLSQIFLITFSMYLVVTIYYTTTYLPLYIQTFQQSVSGFGSEYTYVVGSSFKAPQSTMSEIISFANRISVPAVWVGGGLGTVILFFKKKIHYILFALGLAGGIYLSVGLFYSVLGLRASQILFLALSVGFLFFMSKYKKLTILAVIFILVLSVFGPMRLAYNNTHFQIDEEAEACNFLAYKIKNVTEPSVAIGQVNFGYFTSEYSYLVKRYSIDFAVRPGNFEFINIFNSSLSNNHFILYNTNMGKEILKFVMNKEELIDTIAEIKFNRQIYDCGKTFIINGI